jgi:hypothetical protein
MAKKKTDAEVSTYKLGKLPALHDPRTFQLARYLRASGLPTPPAAQDFEKLVKGWPMMKNDTIGDCTCAAAGHMIEQWTTYSGKPFTPTDQQVVAAYAAITGYNPSTGANDNGALLIDVLNYWRRTGIAGRKILAFAALEPKNHTDFKDALYLFGNVYIGVALPLSAQNQAVWAVPPGGPTGRGAPGSWGGHAIPIVAYDSRGLTVVTWGALKRMTWTFLDLYCDEAYAVLSHDWLDNTKQVTPANFDLATLQQDLSQLGHGKTK